MDELLIQKNHFSLIFLKDLLLIIYLLNLSRFRIKIRDKLDDFLLLIP